MKTLYLDRSRGFSGDLLVGALCALGVKPSALEWELSKLEIGDFHMHFEQEESDGVSGVRFTIHEGATHTHDQDEEHHHHHHGDEEGHSHEHGEHTHVHADGTICHHHHEHDEHDHEHGLEHIHHQAQDAIAAPHSHEHEHNISRGLADIEALIEASDLSASVKENALGIFAALAKQEHAKELGSLDTIAAVICACVGLETLGITKLVTSASSDHEHDHVGIGAALLAKFEAITGAEPQFTAAKTGLGLEKCHGEMHSLRALLGEVA